MTAITAGHGLSHGRITSAPGGAGNTVRGLTHSLDPTKEELDIKPTRETVEERFWSKVEHRGPGCWLWTATINQYGYGRFRHEGKFTTAHRVAWVLTHGPVDEGVEIDHLCRNRACVNPSHLEAVSRSTNYRRGINGFWFDGKCRAGLHGVTSPEAVRVRTDGRRSCLECEREYDRRRDRRKKADA